MTTAILGLLATFGLGVGGAVLRWPELGALLATGILYLNLLPILMRHGVPSMIVAAAAALIVPALVKHWIVDRKGIVVDRPLLIMPIFLATTMVSSIAVPMMDAALRWLARYVAEGIVIYFLVINLFRTRAAIRRVIWVLMLCGAFLASLSLYQEMTGSKYEFGGLATRLSSNELILEGYDRNDRTAIRDANRAQGPDLDANRYAQILIVLLPLGWWLIRGEPRLATKLVAGICSSLILGGVLVTYSRGAFVGLVVMLGLMEVLRLVTTRQLVVSAIALVLSMVVFSPGYTGRIATLVGIQGLFNTTATTEAQPDAVERGRATLMLSAWELFLDHPILGAGPGQFAASYVIDYASEMYYLRRVSRQFRAHSLYLEMAAETGLIGLGVFLAIVIVTLRRLWKARRQAMTRDPPLAGAAAAFLVAIAAYLTTAMFLHLSYQRYYWFLLGLAGATVRVAESSGARPAESGETALV